MSSDPTEYQDGITPQSFNETDPELSGHHLDAPNDSVYMICGVLIAMLLVAVIIVLLAITINKLRKRDDNHNAVTDVVAASPQQTAVSTICSAPAPFSDQQLPQANGTAPPPPPLFLWQYPVYSNDQDSLMHTLPADRPGICRGFRKNLRGRWRRLVKRKPAPEACTIPAELRDQLKQIYVY